jgi:outer membrane biosynthesis protein TonB
MFESISRRAGAAPSRKLSGLAVALAAHAGALAVALLLGKPPELVLVEPPLPPLKGPRLPTGTNTSLVPQPPRGNSGPPIKPTGTPRKQRPPRVTPKPIDPSPPTPLPEVKERPEAPSALAESGPSGPPGVSGPGGPGGSGPLLACPVGETCGPSSSEGEVEKVQVFQPGLMERPRPSCEPPAPLAPAAASQFGLEGSVVTFYVVHSDGHVGEVRVLNADAQPLLAQAVRDWLEHCTFTAARYQERDVSVRMQQTFRFRSR